MNNFLLFCCSLLALTISSWVSIISWKEIQTLRYQNSIEQTIDSCLDNTKKCAKDIKEKTEQVKELVEDVKQQFNK